MALGEKCSSKLKRGNSETWDVPSVNVDQGLQLGHRTRTIGRKRISISDCLESLPHTYHLETPLKKLCCPRVGQAESADSIWLHLEALPFDILVRILCGVNHDDLKQLFRVSKLIKEATLIAKQSHFAFTTPSTAVTKYRIRSCGFRRDPNEDMSLLDNETAPNAPKQQRSCKSRINRKKLADISVALFTSLEEEVCPRSDLISGRSLYIELEV